MIALQCRSEYTTAAALCDMFCNEWLHHIHRTTLWTVDWLMMFMCTRFRMHLLSLAWDEPLKIKWEGSYLQWEVERHRSYFTSTKVERRKCRYQGEGDSENGQKVWSWEHLNGSISPLVFQGFLSQGRKLRYKLNKYKKPAAAVSQRQGNMARDRKRIHLDSRVLFKDRTSLFIVKSSQGLE